MKLKAKKQKNPYIEKIYGFNAFYKKIMKLIAPKFVLHY